MNREKEFDNILNECLESIVSNRATVEQCLQRYPEQAAELEPLLQTVSLANEATDVTPRNDFKIKARYEFQQALRERAEAKERRLFGWRPQWAGVLISVLALLVASSGTVAAASGSMPDEPLYPVKRVTEAVRVALTPSELGKAELYANLIDKRIVEIAKMAEKGKGEELEKTTQLLTEQLIAMTSLVAVKEKTVVVIIKSKHQQ